MHSTTGQINFEVTSVVVAAAAVVVVLSFDTSTIQLAPSVPFRSGFMRPYTQENVQEIAAEQSNGTNFCNDTKHGE